MNGPALTPNPAKQSNHPVAARPPKAEKDAHSLFADALEGLPSRLPGEKNLEKTETSGQEQGFWQLTQWETASRLDGKALNIRSMDDAARTGSNVDVDPKDESAPQKEAKTTPTSGPLPASPPAPETASVTTGSAENERPDRMLPAALTLPKRETILKTTATGREQIVPAKAIAAPASDNPGGMSLQNKERSALQEAENRMRISAGDESGPVRPDAGTGANRHPATATAEAATREGPTEIRVLSVQRVSTPAASAVLTESGEGNADAVSVRTSVSDPTTALDKAATAPGRVLQTLKIQIHPAELGPVTARLRLVSDQLQVDIQVENSEARQKLSNDSDSIVRALRSLGYEIERVTVQQAQSGPGGSTQNTVSGSARDGSFHSANGNGGGHGDQSHDARNGRGTRHGETPSGSANEPATPTSGGVYI